ncbi:MAG: DUF975 family protein [Lachnospiraceae bacterium]
MKRTSAELKRLSRENLIGHWGLAIGASLLTSLIVFALLMPFYLLFFVTGGGMVQFMTYLLAILIIGMVSVILQCGISRMYLGFSRKQGAEIGMLFGEFKRRPDRYLLGCLIIYGISFACILPGYLCWIVGIVGGGILASLIGAILYLIGVIVLVMICLCYSMAFFFLVDYPQMNTLEALRQSAKVMNGNKGRLFYIYLSFIGWYILGILSCGIGMIWISPYMNQTYVNFYLDITGEFDRMQTMSFSQEQDFGNMI